MDYEGSIIATFPGRPGNEAIMLGATEEDMICADICSESLHPVEV